LIFTVATAEERGFKMSFTHVAIQFIENVAGRIIFGKNNAAFPRAIRTNGKYSTE